MKGHKVWLKPKALWAYTQARWKTCCCGIFCSRFHPILSPLKIISEMVFWTNLMLDLICTWLEKTRRFCRQVNKKISSYFWTASTCVQRSSLGWRSRLTSNGNVDWFHVYCLHVCHLWTKRCASMWDFIIYTQVYRPESWGLRKQLELPYKSTQIPQNCSHIGSFLSRGCSGILHYDRSYMALNYRLLVFN